jgi:lipopolysaccharide export system protein LptC
MAGKKRRLPRNLISLVLALAIVTLFAVYLEQQHLGTDPAPVNRAASQHPDLILTNSASTRFGEDGQIRYRTRSVLVRRFPSTDIVRLEKPRITSYEGDRNAWYLTAEHGETLPGREVVRLMEDVILSNPESELEIKTSELSITPDKKYAQTDKPVTITGRGSITTGIGMEAFMMDERVKLLSDVRTHYEKR